MCCASKATQDAARVLVEVWCGSLAPSPINLWAPQKLTGSLRPWMVILTGVGVLVVAATLPALRVLPRCSTGWGRNRLRLAATRGALLAADLCRAALPRLEAIFLLW